ncbi:mavicyanin [Nicotiana tabacum]|uniref:Mavicyanin n=1 Tax=Nicotiana tabacum TaxID=4097 RepID=A0A1S4DGG9_TOBAC|nr:mavicyanin-like [Nicotiana tomentosiformis]XP_016512458.1 PREDICTED: mavicyanin-like [Nicotiana tabacum]
MAFVLDNRPKMALVFLILASFLQLSLGVNYKVGDSAGWTTIGNVDYKLWAANKTFQVGDTIVFKYNPQFHNVMQVTHAEYQSCNASSPIATHTTGNDSITITTHGHHFFLCGVPGHCQAGQKVDINVLRTSSSASPNPSPTSSPLPAVTSVPAPSPSHASYWLPNKIGIVMAVSLVLLFNFA